MHAMWNAGAKPGRIVEIITPGGFENSTLTLNRRLHTADRGIWSR